MIYVQQARSRKRPLVPLNMDNEVKIEFVNMCEVGDFQLMDSNDSTSNSSTETPNLEMVTAETSKTPPVQFTAGAPAVLPNELKTEAPTAGHRPRKRAKLDHLSVEQKAQHRKMMNRISAQSARDRQRALMIQQEQSIVKIAAANSQLQIENKALKLENEKAHEECLKLRSSVAETSFLREENARLKNLVENLEKRLSSQTEFQIKSEPELERENEPCCGNLEPAVLDTYPLLKGQNLQQTSAFLLLISAFSLWISTPQKFSKLSKTSQSKFSAMIQNLLHLNEPLLMKQLQDLQKKLSTQMKAKPPD